MIVFIGYVVGAILLLILRELVGDAAGSFPSYGDTGRVGPGIGDPEPGSGHIV